MTLPAVTCVQCGGSVEPARWIYAHPTCYKCLPPPRPLPLVFGRGRQVGGPVTFTSIRPVIHGSKFDWAVLDEALFAYEAYFDEGIHHSRLVVAPRPTMRERLRKAGVRVDFDMIQRSR